ncbi:UDP-N-acetylglucosamine--N-acetylmuramyl-(pentapeptide) pyrophosphoryl-undecaprenol N-acetylglucosamine transferase [Candidatus Micrarchaeota archaeon]|nr:UDP-N-acetylglucosamine--N-acetylmuramyl-(pentapeptide) pyrophosphoryl-undecaprenol N-acetylglucosamine transferase [Candidatus Micrarchaeota archaeon]
MNRYSEKSSLDRERPSAAKRSSVKPARIVVAAIGTGGHIYPGIEIGSEFRRQGHEVRFIGTTDRMEKDLVPQAGFDIDLIRAEPFAGQTPWGKIRAVAALLPATVRSWQLLKKNRTDAVVTTGAYGSIPVALAAKLRGIPIVAYEPNGAPGMANRFLSRVVNAMYTPFSAFLDRFPRGKTNVAAVVRKRPNTPVATLGKTGFSVWVFGGSQGSKVLNESVLAALPHLDEGIRVTHMTGTPHFEAVNAEYQRLPGHGHRAVPYVDDVAKAYQDADVIVMRGGATTLAEIAAFRDQRGKSRAVIAVPFEGAGGQQTLPTRLQQEGAINVIWQKDLTGMKLANAINRLHGDPQLRDDLAGRLAGQLGSTDGAQRVVETTLGLIRKRKKRSYSKPRK